jgi:hypothetical protein
LGAQQSLVNELPDATLIYLLGSRYCDTDRLATKAWALFGKVEPGWARAILDYTHERITFGYQYARTDRTASECHAERKGVSRGRGSTGDCPRGFSAKGLKNVFGPRARVNFPHLHSVQIIQKRQSDGNNER